MAGWEALVRVRTNSQYLPQKYKDRAQSERAKNVAKPPLAKKVEKASQILAETRKALQKALCAEASVT